jgi:hypothetical protein
MTSLEDWSNRRATEPKVKPRQSGYGSFTADKQQSMAFTALIRSLLKDGSVVRITALFRFAMSKKLAKAASEC